MWSALLLSTILVLSSCSVLKHQSLICFLFCEFEQLAAEIPS